MAPNDSRHLLPMNSIVFNSQQSPRPPRFTISYDPTLANLHEAQDTTITALPQPNPITEKPPTAHKRSIWSRMVNKLKIVFRRHKKEKSASIGSLTEYQHVVTSGPEPLRSVSPPAATVAGAKRDTEGTAVEEDNESDWEDVEETRLFRRE
ncbi:hypothetical protein N0V83_008752 [Neocucurbitaria cava]|uniref:Uncharacterized protein n=1 Tax=Neocucurbitaria cava TaxID=798079 RepID=A0A9W9CJ76_9PLEO|nr:hypothetical protein N0V83_008752 [Neocucurbitaria cava]